jgi:cytochrome P450
MRGACRKESPVGFAGCPLGDPRSEPDERKTAAVAGAEAGPPLERRADGGVRINGFNLASQILRGRHVRQAGFSADLVARLPQKNVSILFKDGEDHRRQRSAVARFFAPTVVAGRYRGLMSDLSARLVAKLGRDKRAALDDMSLALSVAVAAEIVGLTDSLVPGLAGRLNSFFTTAPGRDAGRFATFAFLARSQWNLLLVYLLDVWPAIRARRRTPRADLISHLVEQGWSHLDIVTECITYSAAGMSTTREFIVAAAWHLLERDALRQRFLGADELGRAAILEEILRLEPAVGTLLRRTTQAITLDDGGRPETIAANTLLAIDVRGVNADRSAVGGCPHALDPDRGRGKPPSHMSFGDGPHRCPGSAVAIQETAIFLDQLLRVPGIRLAAEPKVGWNTMTAGYVLRDAIVTVD